MSLAPGARLGAYEILAAIGAGGMGEVYRAHDTRLNRDVAIKILPELFAADADRVARFQREAQMLASLNHPNIAHIHGLEELSSASVGQTGSKALVLELVDGPTLTDLIANGPVPLEDALPIARQIAEALETAHEHGIIHRDLKPANIKLTSDGTVKILDFGLAKAMDANPASALLSMSPTITSPGLVTGGGVILGTAAYMSPEQARGKPVRKYADMWALGCVVFELLTGVQAFAGETVSDTLAAVLTREPDWTKLPAPTPEPLRKILRQCLEKDPKRRLRDAGDFQLELEEALHPAARANDGAPERPPSKRRQATWVAMWAVVLIGVSALAFTSGRRSAAQRSPFPTAWRAEMLGGPTISIGPSISPDGSTLGLLAFVEGQTQVAVMKPQSGNWTVLTRNRSRGIAGHVRWSRDGTRLLFDRFINLPQGIYSVPVLGGEEQLVLENAMGPEPLPDGSMLVTRVNDRRQRQLYRYWPETQRSVALPAIIGLTFETTPVRAFPDGREAVFVGRPLDDSTVKDDRLYVVDLERGATRPIADAIRFEPRWGTYPLAVTPDGKWVLF